MAQLLPDWQNTVDDKSDVLISVYRVTLQSASDTFIVPDLADASTPSNSVAELDDGNNDSGVTVSTSDVNTITLVGGSAGGTVVFAARHNGREQVNFDSGTTNLAA
jgi:hypothetical protein